MDRLYNRAFQSISWQEEWCMHSEIGRVSMIVFLIIQIMKRSKYIENAFVVRLVTVWLSLYFVGVDEQIDSSQFYIYHIHSKLLNYDINMTVRQMIYDKTTDDIIFAEKKQRNAINISMQECTSNYLKTNIERNILIH